MKIFNLRLWGFVLFLLVLSPNKSQAKIENKFDNFDRKNTISSITGDYGQDRIPISKVVSKAYKNIAFSKSFSRQSDDLRYTLSLRIESTQDWWFFSDNNDTELKIDDNPKIYKLNAINTEARTARNNSNILITTVDIEIPVEIVDLIKGCSLATFKVYFSCDPSIQGRKVKHDPSIFEIAGYVLLEWKKVIKAR